jgi:lipoprotein-anchoring transpeptidase ErfK/SrfK
MTQSVGGAKNVNAMAWKRVALALPFMLLPATACLAQAWPPWPEFRLPPSQRFAPNPERGFQERPQTDDGRNNGSLSGDAVQDGGARPVIAPKAPPIVPFHQTFAANSILIDTGGRKLYYVLGDNSAYEYPISVGREGFNWEGGETVSRKQAWPDWYPPAEMRERDPKLPEKMTGGVRNPLGAMALYLGNTLYRIHGTNDVRSIGQAASSGCFRMLNAAVLHLASITEVGTAVTVVKSLPARQEVSRLQEAKPTPKEQPAPTLQPQQETAPVVSAPAEPTTNATAPDYRTLREQALGRR